MSCNSLGKPTFGLGKPKVDLAQAPTTTLSTMYMDILGKVLCRVWPVRVHWLIFNGLVSLGNADLYAKYLHRWFYMQPPK